MIAIHFHYMNIIYSISITPHNIWPLIILSKGFGQFMTVFDGLNQKKHGLNQFLTLSCHKQVFDIKNPTLRNTPRNAAIAYIN